MTRPFQPFDHDTEPTGSEGRQAKENRRAAFRAMIEHAVSGKPLKAVDVAQWHHQLFAGLSHVPNPCYLGGYRGGAHPWLLNYEVEVDGLQATPASRVTEELADLLAEYDQRSRQLASLVIPTQDKDDVALRKVVELAAWVHGKWLQIHPFANGNGRTARLLANHVLARFRVRPVVRLRPRPDPPYTAIATSSMREDYTPAVEWMLEQVES